MKKLRKKIPKNLVKKRKTKMIIIDDRPKNILDAVLALFFIISAGFLAWLLFSNGYFIWNRNDSDVQMGIEGKSEEQKRQELRNAIRTNQLGACGKIEDEKNRTICVNNIANNLAKEKNDPKLCQKLDGKVMDREMCVEQVMGKIMLESESIDDCEVVGDMQLEESCRNNFWITKAVYGNNVDLCEREEDNNRRSFCYDEFVLRVEYFGLNFENVEKMPQFDCEKFRGTSKRNDCRLYSEIIKSKNYDRCSNIEEVSIRSLCAK